MAKRDEIVKFINEYLAIEKFKDDSVNGLQVIGKEEVKKIVLGVSASLELFKKAASRRVDMIIVHHGMFWENKPQVVGSLRKNRLKVLFDNGISLLGYHLPLDGHSEIGNSAQIVKKLGLIPAKEKFGTFEGNYVGALGRLRKEERLSDFVKRVDKVFNSKSFVLNFGLNMIKTVGIISGGAGGVYHVVEAAESGCDVYLTGNPFESGFAAAKEMKINVIGPGHYNTEKFGIQALGKLLEKKFKVKTEFIDIPNPL